MKSRLMALILAVVGLSAPSFGYAVSEEEANAVIYGSHWNDKYREITYWGAATLAITDYDNGSKDAERLNLSSKDIDDHIIPRDDIAQHFTSELKKYFGDLPFHDDPKGHEERLGKFVRDHSGDRGMINKFDAAEEARRRSLYGGRAGAIRCLVRIKRKDFPVLYQIGCSVSADNYLRWDSSNEMNDLGFSSPEYIADEIKIALTKMLKALSIELSKMRKYGKR